MRPIETRNEAFSPFTSWIVDALKSMALKFVFYGYLSGVMGIVISQIDRGDTAGGTIYNAAKNAIKTLLPLSAIILLRVSFKKVVIIFKLLTIL